MDLSRKLAAFLDSRGVRYDAGRQSFITDCIDPTCGKERHMYIRRHDGQSICFKCGNKWGWKRLVSVIADCSWKDSYSVLHGRGAAEYLDKELPLDPDLMEREPTGSGSKRELGDDVRLGPDFIPWHKSGRAMKYLDSRGLTMQDKNLLDFYDVRYHALMDAVVFPIKENGKTYGYQARRIDPKEKQSKTVNMKGFDKSKFLLCRSNYWDHLFLVEGPFDLLHVDRALDGIQSAATMGKSVSLDQLKLIIDSPCKNVYLGLDADAAEEIYNLIDALYLEKTVFRVSPPEGKDFGECSVEEVKKSMEQALLTTSVFLEVYLKHDYK